MDFVYYCCDSCFALPAFMAAFHLILPKEGTIRLIAVTQSKSIKQSIAKEFCRNILRTLFGCLNNLSHDANYLDMTKLLSIYTVWLCDN